MTARTRRLVALLLLVTSASTSLPALADDDAARSAALRNEGNRLMDERKYEEAIARFQEALRLTPNEPALYYNISRVYEVRGDAVAALDSMEQFLARATPELKARIPQLDSLVDGMRKRVTQLHVVCNVPASSANQESLARALIFLDRQVVAQGCTTHQFRVRAGRTTLHAEAEGFVGTTLDVVLPGGDAKQIQLDLAPRDTSGLLRLRAEPEHVSVRLGDRELGQTPLEAVLAAGSYRFELSAPGYEDLTQPVVLSANATRDITAHLEKTPPITSRWWFWTGIGVAVAAGVALGIALTTERHPDHGTIPPGVTKLPLRGSF